MQVVNNAPTFQTVHYNAGQWNALSASILGSSKGTIKSAANAPAGYQTDAAKKPSGTQIAIATQVGGVMVAGGAALMVGSGTTLAGLGAASLSAAVLFTGGMVLVVIGIALVSYYGWQCIQSESPTDVTDVSLGNAGLATERWPQ